MTSLGFLASVGGFLAGALVPAVQGGRSWCERVTVVSFREGHVCCWPPGLGESRSVCLLALAWDSVSRRPRMQPGCGEIEPRALPAWHPNTTMQFMAGICLALMTGQMLPFSALYMGVPL